MSEREDIDALRARLGVVLEGLGDAQIAAQIGVPKVRKGSWIGGRHVPTTLTLLRIIRGFGLSAEWLLFGRGPMRLGETTEEREEEGA